MKRKIKTSVSIDAAYLEVADQLAAREDRSRSYIIDKIIQTGLMAAAADSIENFSQTMRQYSKELKERGRKQKSKTGHISEKTESRIQS